jgi:hypothetical protein
MAVSPLRRLTLGMPDYSQPQDHHNLTHGDGDLDMQSCVAAL